MSIKNFHGETFVAFMDISGFKVFMKDKDKAYKALDKFYNIGYDSLKSNSNQNDINRVDGLFISDCGILFSRFCGENYSNLDFQPYQASLRNLLNIIEQISRKMIRYEYMLTVSIAYGKFDYHERIVFSGMDKNFLLGNAYLDAYSDEKGKPKLDPGQCRILINDQINGFWTYIQNLNEEPFNRISKKPNDTKHLYFYWMISDKDDIKDFNKKYNDTYNQKYKGMIDVLRQFTNQNDPNSR
jgi:hypothetical protein